MRRGLVVLSYDISELTSPSTEETIVVGVEHDESLGCVYIRDVRNGHYLSAHKNRKHVYWTEDKDKDKDKEAWTWERFYILEPTRTLCTSHGTYIYPDPGEDAVWQMDEDDITCAVTLCQITKE